jgi:pyrroline-5-carboxylate reductase
MSIVVPLQISSSNPLFKPFIVQATLDAAVIAGMPASKAAKKYAVMAQQSDALIAESFITSEPVSWRRLYFRKLFS